MAWSRKKIVMKVTQYLEHKHISYDIDEDFRIRLELFFKEHSFMIYPYMTIENQICSINVNVSEQSLKGLNYEKLNTFNVQSKFFKAYISSEGVIVLEYRFIIQEVDSVVLDAILDSLYVVEEYIDRL